jgi:hypothetical protein
MHLLLPQACPFSILAKEVFRSENPKLRNTDSKGRLFEKDPIQSSKNKNLLTTLLCAFSEANDTVPRKSAFFLAGTGCLRSSIKCLFARPKSTINTYLLSFDNTKLDYILL